MNRIHPVSLGAAAALLLAMGGCGGGGAAQSTAEVRKDAAQGAMREAEARMDATYDKEQARKHSLDATPVAATPDTADVRVAAFAAAEQAHAAALSRCGTLAVGSQGPCTEQAESEFATAKARAEAAPRSGNSRP